MAVNRFKEPYIVDMPTQCELGETVQFGIDASGSGEGVLEISVANPFGEVPNQVQVQGNGRCAVSFKPELSHPHVVDIKFNGQNVPGW